MLKLVLDVEVGRVIEDGHDLLAVVELIALAWARIHVAVWGDWDGVEWDWLGGVGHWGWAARCNFGHVCRVV